MSPKEIEERYSDPDFFNREIAMMELLAGPEPAMMIKEETPGVEELNDLFLDLSIDTPEKLIEASFDSSAQGGMQKLKHEFKFGKKKSSGLVRNEVLGYVPQDVIDEALRRGAITKKEFMNNIYWCIPVDEVLIGEEGGKILSHPRKTLRISEKYIQFRKDLKQGKIKINNTLI